MTLTTQLICDIIKNGLDLDNDQIWVYNQRRSIPNDKRLYVVVGMISAKPYGNNFYFNGNQTTPTETLAQWMQELMSIHVFSYTTEVYQKYPMIIGSLVSSYSERLQEENALKIARVPMSISDTSHIEGASMLNRIAVSLQVLRKYSNILTTDYYTITNQHYHVTGEQ